MHSRSPTQSQIFLFSIVSSSFSYLLIGYMFSTVVARNVPQAESILRSGAYRAHREKCSSWFCCEGEDIMPVSARLTILYESAAANFYSVLNTWRILWFPRLQFMLVQPVARRESFSRFLVRCGKDSRIRFSGARVGNLWRYWTILLLKPIDSVLKHGMHASFHSVSRDVLMGVGGRYVIEWTLHDAPFSAPKWYL